MPDLRSLARSLDLSTTTVSRALDGYSDVSEATRQRVREAAGYRPNASARRLRKQKAEVVAVPLPIASGRIGTPHLLDLLSGCAERLARAHLALMIAPVPKGESELDLCRRFVDGRRVDAMLLVRTRRQDERVAYLQSRGLPFVTDGRTEGAAHAWMDGDGRDGFLRAARRFIADGHRRIGLVGGDEDFFFAHARAEGWRAALREAGLAQDLHAQGELSEQGGFEACRRLLALPDPPTAILCATDEMAFGALGAIRAGGRDVAVVGHDDLPAGAYTDPPLSSMRMAGENLGQRIGELLLGAMEGRPAEELQILNPVAFVDRQSHLRRSTAGPSTTGRKT